MAVIFIGLVLGISIGGFYSDWDWRLAWYSNLRPHFMIASLLVLLWFLLRHNRLMAAVSLLAGLINLFVLVPFFISPATNIIPGQTLSIAHLNTNRGEASLSELDDIAVDILLLQEVTPELMETLPELFTAYELVHAHPMANTQGSAVLIHKASAVEVIRTEIIHLPADSSRPLLATKIKFGDTFVQLLNFHVIKPHHKRADRYQQVELNALAQWSRQIQQDTADEVLIVGDFNTTPWAGRFLKLLAEGQLNDSLRGYGLQSSWPSSITPRFLGIPIDHALYSDGLATVDRSTVVVSGSDHALLQVTLALNSPPSIHSAP